MREYGDVGILRSMSHPQDQRLMIGFFGIIFVLLFLQAMFPPRDAKRDLTQPAQQDCVGTPLYVPYEYNGTTVDPWSCQPQCTDQKQHYLVYTNGMATECETLPGCNDAGEDNGVTCHIPNGAVPVSPVSKKG